MASEFVDRLKRFREELVADRHDTLQAAMDATRMPVRETCLERARRIHAQIAVIDETIREEAGERPS
jgi:hypothetical protein